MILMSCDEVENIINSYDVDQYLSERLEKDAEFIDYDVLCKEMLSSELLSDTNKFILGQSFKTLEAGLYDLALVGVVIVFDGVLSEAICDVSTSISKRIDSIRKKMERLSDEAWEHLGENEIKVFGMYITWTETMERFQMYSKFGNPVLPVA